MLHWILQKYPGLILAGTLVLLNAGCSRSGMLIPGDTLAIDATYMSKGDLSGPGPQQVISKRVTVNHHGENLSVALFQPVHVLPPAPAVVFLPGRMVSYDQYESYALALASRGFIVVMRDWYSPFASDIEISRDAIALADWLVRAQGVNPKKIGVAGHSMGGKAAVLAAAQSGVFASVVSIDPDDHGKVSVVHGMLAQLRAPLLLIGAELAWRASRICAPKTTNYLRFFERAPPGTIELTLRHADHVQMLDDPDHFGYGICRSGTADSRQVRITARRATVGFFVQHLLDGPVMPKPSPILAFIRVARDHQVTEK